MIKRILILMMFLLIVVVAKECKDKVKKWSIEDGIEGAFSSLNSFVATENNAITSRYKGYQKKEIKNIVDDEEKKNTLLLAIQTVRIEEELDKSTLLLEQEKFLNLKDIQINKDIK